MKKLIAKYWGVVLAVVLLSSLFVSAAPVSAGTLSFTVAANPNDVIGGIISAGEVVYDFDVANDGTTVYAATSTGVRKSVNGGKTWSLAVKPAGVMTVHQVEVCPDNANFAVFMDQSDDNPLVYLTTNGGSSWSSLGTPRNAAGTVADDVYDIAVSPTVGGVNYIAVAGTNGAGTAPALYYFTYGITIPAWTNAAGDAPWTYALTPTETAFWAVEFSANFNADFIALVVGTDPGAFHNLHAVSFNVFKWDAGIPAFGATYPAAIYTAGTVTAPLKATIVTDPLYYGGDSVSRLAYVGITTGGAANTGAGVFRMTDNAPADLSPLAVLQPQSLSINADGTKLYIGSANTNNVLTCSNPSSVLATITNSRTSKRIGLQTTTDNTTAKVAGSSVYTASNNTGGAFGVSADGGLSFNAISLVNVAVAGIVDQAVSADATKRYVMLQGGGNSYLFYNDGTGWVNTFVVAGVGFVVSPSPVNFDTVYIGDKTANLNIYYSATAGMTNWYTRAAPGTGFIADIEVLNDSTIYALTTNGACAKSSTNGFIWSPAFAAGATGAALTLVAEDALIASHAGATGTGAYTTNNGLNWIPLAAPVAAGVTYFDAAGLATGDNVYAVNTTDNNIYTYTLGSAAWVNPAVAIGAAGMLGQAVYLDASGLLYAMYTDNTNIQFFRSMDPIFGAFATWTNATTNTAPAGALTGIVKTDVGPNAMKVTNGSQFWFANSFAAPFNVVTYTDTLADPANVPTLVNPANGFLVQVNNETGIAYNTNIMFGDASTATRYELQVAYDDGFTNLVTGAGIAVNSNFLPTPQTYVIGPTGTTVMQYQPGQTLYWRVRADRPFLSGWSATGTFSIMPGQAVVAMLASPENGSTVSSLTPGFSWSPLGGISSYKFELAEAPDFATTLYSTTTTTAGAAVPSTVKLVRGTTYYWRVKALTPTEGEWSAVGNFMVAELVKTTTPAPQVTPTLTVVLPDVTTTQITITQEAPKEPDVVNPSYIWAIIIIGAVLVIAVIVLIVRTRRSV